MAYYDSSCEDTCQPFDVATSLFLRFVLNVGWSSIFDVFGFACSSFPKQFSSIFPIEWLRWLLVMVVLPESCSFYYKKKVVIARTFRWWSLVMVGLPESYSFHYKKKVVIESPRYILKNHRYKLYVLAKNPHRSFVVIGDI